MTDLEYKTMIDEAHSIPILDVANLVMESVTKRSTSYTAKCPNHADNKLGNISFNFKYNCVKCFSCGASFTTINLVKTCNNLGFKDAIAFLYQHFPSYFTKAPDYTNSGECVKWEGLTNDEYRFLKLETKFLVEGKFASIRVFATMFPEEHDKILIRKMKDIYNEIYLLYNDMSNQGVKLSKLDKERKDFEDKLLNLLKKGLINKKRIDKNATDFYEVLKSL